MPRRGIGEALPTSHSFGRILLHEHDARLLHGKRSGRTATSGGGSTIVLTQPITVIPYNPNNSKSNIFSRIELFERDDVPSTWRQEAYVSTWTMAQDRLTALVKKLYMPAFSSLRKSLDIQPGNLFPVTVLDGTSIAVLTIASECECLLGSMASGARGSPSGTQSSICSYDTGSVCQHHVRAKRSRIASGPISVCHSRNPATVPAV